jgi:hypothetical protein
VGGGDDERAQDGLSGFPLALSRLETAILGACAAEAEWPAQVVGGVCAGVDFAIANPALARALIVEMGEKTGGIGRYERVIGRLTGFIQVKAPHGKRLPGATDEALVAGLVGLVGDHIRLGRLDRLAELRPDLVLMVLLPYLGFADAQRWANQVARSRTSGA